MKDPHIETRKLKKGDPYVNFTPEICLTYTGKTREPKKGEVWKLVQQGRYQFWDEPPLWFFLEHIPFRMMVGWYVQSWWHDAYASAWFAMHSRFSITAARIGMQHGDDFCIFPRYIERLEQSARRWRTIALSVVAVFVISILIPYLLMR